MNALRITLLILICLVSSGGCWAASIAGDWEGFIQGENLHIVLHVQSGSATADSPDQGAMNIPATILVDASNNVNFTIASPSPFIFNGTLNGDSMSGTWTEGGKSGTLVLTKQDEPAAGPPPAPKATIAGDWAGAIRTQNQRIVVHVKGKPGHYNATADCPDQGLSKIPATASLDSGNHVVLIIQTPLPFFFTGNLSGSTIVGAWTQNGVAGDLTLTKQGG